MKEDKKKTAPKNNSPKKNNSSNRNHNNVNNKKPTKPTMCYLKETHSGNSLVVQWGPGFNPWSGN